MYDIVDTTAVTSTPSASTGTSGHSIPSGMSTTVGHGSSTASMLPTTSGAYSGSTLTSSPATSTTTKRCEEMQAVDESTSKKITVSPVDVPDKDKVEFQPTSNKGVSFPDYEKTPTITVNFGKPAEVQSVIIPRDKTYGANVKQFEVTFYSPDGKKINEKPLPSTVSPTDDKTKRAYLDKSQIPSDKPVSRLEIKVVSTTDDQSPKGVILDIKACTEATTGELIV